MSSTNSLLLSRHEHHHTASEIDPSLPRGSLIFVHAGLQALAWGLVFPLGMVLGLKKSRWHIPVQVAGLAMTGAGFVLGHHHGGEREYAEAARSSSSSWSSSRPSPNGPMALVLLAMLVIQASTGVYLKLHLQRLRAIPLLAHKLTGRLYPLVGAGQIALGVQMWWTLCLGEEQLQCLAHWTFGFSYVLYGSLLAIMAYCGQDWLKRKGQSQELYDSLMILTFGIINTFSMRHSDGWSMKDLQHTALGVLWWAGGALGVFMSLGGKRHWVPAMVFIMTGFAFGAHMQHVEGSALIHTMLGSSMAAAGIARIVEICFVLREGYGDQANVKSWQHLYPFLLFLTGCIFASATDEQIKALNAHNIDPTTYLLVMFALAFFLYFVVVVVISAYVSPWFGVSRPAGASPASLESGGGGIGGLRGLFSRPPAKNEQGYDLVDGGGAELFELGAADDDGSDGGSRDSFERELDEDAGSDESGRKVGRPDDERRRRAGA